MMVQDFEAKLEELAEQQQQEQPQQQDAQSQMQPQQGQRSEDQDSEGSAEGAEPDWEVYKSARMCPRLKLTSVDGSAVAHHHITQILHVLRL